MNQLYPFLLLRGHYIQVEPLGCGFEAAIGNIHLDNLFKLSILEKFTNEFAFSTTKIKNSLGTACSQFRRDQIEADIVKSKRRFNGLFLLLPCFLFRIGVK